MKRIYFFMIALLTQLISFSVFAQPNSLLVQDLGEALIYDVAQITSNASDEAEGKDIGALIDGDSNSFWHSDWHNKVTDPHYVQFELFEPIESGKLIIYLQRRNTTSGNHMKKAKVEASADGEKWDNLGEYELPKPEPLAEVLFPAIEITKPYSFVRITNIKVDAIFFHAAEINLYNPRADEFILSILNNILGDYDQYYWNEDDLNMGEDFGQHNDYATAEEFKAFIEKIIAMVDDPSTEGFPKTEEEANALRAKADELFQKIMASEVLFRLPAETGYYRIISNLPYIETYNTGEKDENDQPIMDERYVTKAIFSSLDNQGSWGTLKNRANYIWKLTQVGDSIDVYNVGMNSRFNIVGDDCWLAEDGNRHFIFDFVARDEDLDGNEHDVLYIRAANAPRNSNQYLHQKGHNKGKQTADQGLCVWNGTYNMTGPYDGDKGTSEWYLEPVDESEVAELVAAFEDIKNHDLLVEKNNALRAEVGAALTTAKDVLKTNLLTSADQFSSPYSQNDCGGGRDGGDLSAGVLIDGDKGSFWHSAWSGDIPAGQHYIQLSGMTEMTGEVEFYICRRSGADNDHLKHMKLMASNDEFADDADWVELADLELGNASKDQEYTTPFFNVGETAYEYVRIVGTEQAPSTRGFWHAAEIQIRIIRENPNSQFAALGEIAIALEEIYNQNMATDDADITPEMYNALLDAFRAFNAGLVDPTELRNALAKYAKVTLAVEEGTEPGQWEDTSIAEAFDEFYAEVTAYDKAGRYTEAQNHKYALQLKAMSQTVMEKANGLKENTWYNIKFPTEEMYEKYGWNPANVGGESKIGTYQWGSIAMAGEQIVDEDGTLLDMAPVVTDEMREGTGLYFIEEDYMEEEDPAMFRFIKHQAEVNYTAPFAEVMQTAALALEMNTSISKAGEGLITNAAQLSSNASDSSEGKNIQYLIDGKASTFWHTDYHKEATAPHYLQVALNEPVSGLIQVEVTRRQNISYGHATRFYLQGSNDGQNWTRVGYVELPYTNLNETVLSAPVELKEAFSYLRFTLTHRAALDKEFDPFCEATSSDTDENWTYFHAAEFQIYPAVDNSTLSEAGVALKDAYAELNKVVYNKVTEEDYNAAKAAYAPYRAEQNAAAGKEILPEMAHKELGVEYAIQNKANGLFIYADAAKSNEVTLQTNPTYFSFKALGYDECLLRGTNADGTDVTALHSQNWNHRLVTWDVYSANTNSGLVIRETGEEYTPAEYTFIRDIKPGKINNWCSATTVIPNGEGTAYTGLGQFTNEEGTFLAMKEIEVMEAGMPVFYIYEDTLNYIAEDDYTEPMKFTISAEPEFVTEGATVNGFIGAICKHSLKPLDLYFGHNYAEYTGAEGYVIRANRVIVDMELVPEVDAEAEYDFCICIGENGNEVVDGIQTSLQNVSKSGAIYTIDGRLVRENGTLNDMKALGRGMYILNGVKVMVK